MNKWVGELVALYRRTAGPSLAPPFLLAHYDLPNLQFLHIMQPVLPAPSYSLTTLLKEAADSFETFVIDYPSTWQYVC